MGGRPPADLDFRAAFAGVPTPLMVMNRDITIVYTNGVYLGTTVRTLPDISGCCVLDAFPGTPERIEPFRRAIERTLAGEEMRAGFTEIPASPRPRTRSRRSPGP